MVIHHATKNFSVIVEEASALTGIPILSNISDYTEEDRQCLVKAVQDLHDIDNGRVIRREYHKMFHK